MPVIQISTFKMNDTKKAEKLLEEITDAMHRVTGVPLDKISVFINEIDPAYWADAGVVGTSPDFKTKSRRLNYE